MDIIFSNDSKTCTKIASLLYIIPRFCMVKNNKKLYSLRYAINIDNEESFNEKQQHDYYFKPTTYVT